MSSGFKLKCLPLVKSLILSAIRANLSPLVLLKVHLEPAKTEDSAAEDKNTQDKKKFVKVDIHKERIVTYVDPSSDFDFQPVDTLTITPEIEESEFIMDVIRDSLQASYRRSSLLCSEDSIYVVIANSDDALMEAFLGVLYAFEEDTTNCWNLVSLSNLRQKVKKGQKHD